jgi:hypothetical protein
VASTRAAVIPTFNAAASSATVTHDPGTPGGGAPFVSAIPIANGSAVLSAPFNPHTDSFLVGGNSVSTTAKAGFGRTQSTTTVKGTFASGMGVDQQDPGHAQTASSMQMDFTLVWDIIGGTFGPPLIGSFSIPVGANVGASGSASFSCNLHWNAVINGVATSDLRTPYIVSQNFGPGITLTSFTAPAAAFSPSSLTDNPGKTDQIILTGFVKFTANNDADPTIVETPTIQDFKDLASMPELQYEPFFSFEPPATDPEPASLGVLAAGTMLLLRRRPSSFGRRRAAS